MDDVLSAVAIMFTWLGDGAVAFAIRWFRGGLRRKRVCLDPRRDRL
jgi:hypothetical protein